MRCSTLSGVVVVVDTAEGCCQFVPNGLLRLEVLRTEDQFNGFIHPRVLRVDAPHFHLRSRLHHRQRVSMAFVIVGYTIVYGMFIQYAVPPGGGSNHPRRKYSR
jgi:hypothetical protein